VKMGAGGGSNCCEAQRGRWWRRSGVNCYPSAAVLFLILEITVDLGRTLWSGNGGPDLAIHASTPQEPRRSTMHGNQGNRADFFHPHAGRAVKYGQQPGRAAAGPTVRLVLSESGHPSRGWRDGSRKSGISTDVALRESRSCSTQGARLARISLNFRGMYIKHPEHFWC
jgi:hypothetical protein